MPDIIGESDVLCDPGLYKELQRAQVDRPWHTDGCIPCTHAEQMCPLVFFSKGCPLRGHIATVRWMLV